MLFEEKLREEHEAGFEEGRAEGEKLFGDLMTRLKASDRIDDAFKAASDADYRQKLYQEFQMS